MTRKLAGIQKTKRPKHEEVKCGKVEKWESKKVESERSEGLRALYRQAMNLPLTDLRRAVDGVTISTDDGSPAN
jgi:hypothetical protein